MTAEQHLSMKTASICLLSSVLLISARQTQGASKVIFARRSIVGKWIAKSTEMMGVGLRRVNAGRDEVEFFKNGNYIWIEEGITGLSTFRGTYVYRKNFLVAYENYNKRTVNGHYHFIGQASILSKNTLELVTSDGMMRILYERKW